MAGTVINPQSKGTEDKNLQITRLEGEKLRIDHVALRSVFTRPELDGKKFAIISIAGKMRTGKSFLMNFVLRYLRRRGWEDKDWMGDDDYAIDVDGLPFAGGAERCTTGIRIFDEIFEVPIEGDETMMVMLMDTQGLFDNKTPEVVNKSLLTLTTLMSSVQIFNSKDNIDSQSMEYLKTCVDFALRTAKTTEKQGVNSEGYMKLQNLLFLVRDFPEDDDEIFGLETGNKYLHDILSSKQGGDELIKIRSRIKESFDSVEGFVLPHPGSKATRKKFQARNKDIDDLFRVYVQKFVEHIMNPRNLVPKRSSTKAITPREMLNMTAACDRIFADKMIDAQKMMKMNEKTYYSSMCQEAIMAYDNLMKGLSYKDFDVDGLQKKHEESKKNAVQKLKEAEFVGEDDTSTWKEQYMQHFSTQCEDHFANTMQAYNIQKQNAELEATRLLLKYESHMKAGMSPPLSDRDFEALHKNELAALGTCGDSGALDNITHRVIEVYERLKEENNCNRRREEKEREDERQKTEKEVKKRKLIQRLLRESQRKWDEFLEIQPDDADMLKKKEEMFSKIFTEFSEETGQGRGAAREELLDDLNRHYKDAKRQNEMQWNLERHKIRNVVDELVLIVRRTLSKQMVDCYINEEAIRGSFRQLMEQHSEAVLDTKLKSERAKQYFKERMKKKCNEATEDALEQNSKNKKSNDIEMPGYPKRSDTATFIHASATVATAGLMAAGLIVCPEVAIPALWLGLNKLL